MLRMTFAGIAVLSTMLLLACGVSAPPPTATAVPESTDSAAQVSIQEKIAVLEASIDDAVEQFSSDVATNAARMFQHTVWVLREEDTIAEELGNNGYELVGDVVRGADLSGNGMDIWGVESPPMSGGQAYVATTGDKLVVAFRSTTSDDGWEVTMNVLTDIKAYPTKLGFIADDVPQAKDYRKINVHAGFHNEYLRYREIILEYVSRHPDKDIYVTGHSLGGALAVLNAFDIVAHTRRQVTVFTFGQPRIGGEKFRKAYEELVPDSYRVVVDGDPIPRTPGVLIDYEHVGKLLQVNQEGGQLPPDDIRSSALFQLFDFPKHVLRSYYISLKELQTICDTSESQENVSCLNVGWLVDAADAEREASRQAWEVVPKDSIPWENIPLDQVSIEKIPVDKLPTEFPNLEMPPWTKMTSVGKIFVDNVPIDEIPLDSLNLDEIPLDDLLDDFSVDKLPVDKLPLDKIPFGKMRSKKKSK